MTTETIPSRNPCDWVYCYVDPDREKSLRQKIPFQEIVNQILNGTISSKKPPIVESNKEPLVGVQTPTSFDAGTCKRIVLHLVIDKRFHDIFVNGVSGLFAKYYQSRIEGRKATQTVIDAVRKNDSFFHAAIKSDKTIELLWNKSLNGMHGIAWFDEDEFPNKKFKRGAINCIGPEQPQIRSKFWKPRAVFMTGRQIVIKGAWIGPEDEIAVHESKRNNDELVASNGFA